MEDPHDETARREGGQCSCNSCLARPAGDAFLPSNVTPPGRRIVHARRPPPTTTSSSSNANNAGGNINRSNTSPPPPPQQAAAVANSNYNAFVNSSSQQRQRDRIVFDFGGGSNNGVNNSQPPVFNFGNGSNNSDTANSPSNNNNDDDGGDERSQSQIMEQIINRAITGINNATNPNDAAAVLTNIMMEIENQLSDNDDEEEEESMPPLEDLPSLSNNNNNAVDNDEIAAAAAAELSLDNDDDDDGNSDNENWVSQVTNGQCATTNDLVNAINMNPIDSNNDHSESDGEEESGGESDIEEMNLSEIDSQLHDDDEEEVESLDDSDDDMPTLVDRNGNNGAAIGSGRSGYSTTSDDVISNNGDDEYDSDYGSMPPLEDFNNNDDDDDDTSDDDEEEEEERGGNYNRFDALNNDDDDNSSGSDSSDDDSSAGSIPPLMNRDDSTSSGDDDTDDDDSDANNNNDAGRFVMGGGAARNNNGAAAGRRQRRRVGGGAAGGGANNRRNNARRGQRQQQQRVVSPGGLFNLDTAPVDNDEEEGEEDEDNESFMNDDDHIHFIEDDDEEDEGDERNNDGNRQGGDGDGGIPPGFRRFMEDMAGFPVMGRGGPGGGGGGGGMFNIAPPGFPGEIMVGRGGVGPPGNDDDLPPFLPPFLRNLINMQDMGGEGGPGARGGNNNNRNGNGGRSRRLNTVIKPDEEHCDDDYTDSDEESYDGICTGANRCAACFRGDDQSHPWRRLVTLPCCGTDGKEESSSTRFCAACVLRMATVNRSDEPGSTGEYDRWDDERYEYPVKKFYSKDNLETESRRFIECPRCRNLLLVKMTGLRTIPNDDDTDSEDACDCSDCVEERRERRANRPKTKSAASITITKPPFKLKSLFIGRKRGVAKLLWRLLYFNHGFINLDALGGEENKTNVLKLVTWGVLQKVPGKNNNNIYRMDKKEQALLWPLFRLSKNASEKDKDKQKALYACTMFDTVKPAYHFLKQLRIDRSLRMLNQLGVQILSVMDLVERLPLSPSQALAVTSLNIYAVTMILQLSIILAVYLFFLFAVGFGVCYGLKRRNKAKMELWQQGAAVLGVYGLGVALYAAVRRASVALIYGLLFPKAVSVLKSIHQPLLRQIDAAFDACGDLLLPKVGVVLQHPVVWALAAPYALVAVYYCVDLLASLKQRRGFTPYEVYRIGGQPVYRV